MFTPRRRGVCLDESWECLGERVENVLGVHWRVFRILWGWVGVLWVPWGVVGMALGSPGLSWE